MSSVPPPNDDLAELVALLGSDSVRLLVRTFLREYPGLLHQLSTGDRRTRHRIAHSLKSNARVIGARALSARMAEIENLLADEKARDLDTAEITQIADDFDRAAQPLRVFAGM